VPVHLTSAYLAGAQSGRIRFRGIRQGVAWDGDESVGKFASRVVPPHLVRDATFREDFETRGAGVELQSWQYHPQLSDAIDLARAFPDTTIILDMWAGCSEPNLILSAVRRSCPVWQRDIKELAQCPNVNVKLGGIGMTSFGFEFHERDVPPSSEDLATAWRHYVQPCIEASGVNRCIFESNFHRISSPTVTPNCGTRSSVSLPAPR
jgi:L-fuconolactonase